MQFQFRFRVPAVATQRNLLAFCALASCGFSLHAAESETSFGDFWTRFRSAVLERKWEQIKSCTEFPLKTHGTLDRSPKRKIAESKFQAVFERFLAQPADYEDKLGAISEEQQIRKLSAPPPNAQQSSESWARVEDMEFHRTTSGWKLYLIYLDEE